MAAKGALLRGSSNQIIKVREMVESFALMREIPTDSTCLHRAFRGFKSETEGAPAANMRTKPQRASVEFQRLVPWRIGALGTIYSPAKQPILVRQVPLCVAVSLLREQIAHEKVPTRSCESGLKITSKHVPGVIPGNYDTRRKI